MALLRQREHNLTAGAVREGTYGLQILERLVGDVSLEFKCWRLAGKNFVLQVHYYFSPLAIARSIPNDASPKTPAGIRPCARAKIAEYKE